MTQDESSREAGPPPSGAVQFSGLTSRLEPLGRAIGVIAGALGIVYLIGGLGVALRMLVQDLSLNQAITVVGQLPRDYLLTSGFLPLAVAVLAGLLAWLAADALNQLRQASRTRRRGNHGRESSGPGTGYAADRYSALVWWPGVVFAAASVVWAVFTFGPWPALIVLAPGIVVAATAQRAALSLLRSLGTVRSFDVLLVCIAIAVPGALMFVTSQGFEKATVCTEGVDMSGRLIAETDARVVIAAPEDAAGNLVFTVPVGRVQEVQIGDIDDSETSACPD